MRPTAGIAATLQAGFLTLTLLAFVSGTGETGVPKTIVIEEFGTVF